MIEDNRQSTQNLDLILNDHRQNFITSVISIREEYDNFAKIKELQRYIGFRTLSETESQPLGFSSLINLIYHFLKHGRRFCNSPPEYVERANRIIREYFDFSNPMFEQNIIIKDGEQNIRVGLKKNQKGEWVIATFWDYSKRKG